jgi:hypothetical protein
MMTLMMDAVRTSETSVNFKQTTRRYVPEGSNLHIRCSEKMKSHKACKFYIRTEAQNCDVNADNIASNQHICTPTPRSP